MPAKIIYTQEQKQDIINIYTKEMKSSLYIAKIYNCTDIHIRDILEKWNIKIRSLAESQHPELFMNLNKIIQEYKTDKSVVSLARKFNSTKGTISKILDKHGIRKLTSNKSNCQSTKKLKNLRYFASIDSSEKAYWLGYLYADGNQCNDVIQLNCKDKEHLNNFKHSLSANFKIATKDVYLKQTNKTYRNYSVSFKSKIMCSDLSDKGIIPNKTYDKLKLPYIPKQFIVDYIRGIIDGDGSLSIPKKQRSLCLSITNTNIELLEYIKLYFGKGSIGNKKGTIAKQFRITISNKINLLKKIYYPSCLCLRRKKVNLLKYCRLLEKSSR
jgi:intein/homing endonuclease